MGQFLEFVLNLMTLAGAIGFFRNAAGSTNAASSGSRLGKSQKSNAAKARKKDCDREIISVDEFKVWMKNS